MALFPAYSTNTNNENEESKQWLQNLSCPVETPVSASVNLSDDKVYNLTTDQRNENDIHQDSLFKYNHKRLKLDCTPESDSNDPDLPRKKSKKKSSKSPKSYIKSSKKSKKKSKKRKSTDESKYEKPRYTPEEKCLQIPTHNAESKNIFLEAHLQLSLSENLSKGLYYDRLPDKNNSIFCNTHYSQVAKYFRVSPLPLGLDSCHTSAKHKKKKDRRYFSKLHRPFPSSIPLIKLAKEGMTSKEYIPLHLSYEEEKEVEIKSKTLSTMQSLNILDPSTEDYILGRSKTSVQEESPSQEMNPERMYWQNQIKSYNERLAKEPKNVTLWLEFVDIQDRAISHIMEMDNSKGNVKGKSYKLLVERKISVLETAITKNIRSLQLQLKRLQLGENIWDDKKMQLEWDKLAANFPNDLNMWYRYLIFHQTYFSAFHLDRVVRAFAKCSDRLRQMQQGTFLSHKPPENIGHALIDVATQLAYAWYQGGHMERSIALFQALIELNLFCPDQLKHKNIQEKSKLALFEAFWDSKAPRFGEKDSVGWAKVMERREPVAFSEEILEGTHDEEDDILAKGGDKHDLWIQLESSRERNHWLPWQQDPENCEDLERMVSFSTLKRHLFFTTSTSESFYLIVQFLAFLGISIPAHILSGETLSPISVFLPLRLESLRNLIPRKELSRESIFNFPVIGPSILEKESEIYFTFVCEIINGCLPLISKSNKPKLGCILIRLLKERSLAIQQDFSSSSLTIKSYKKMIKNLLKQNEFRSDLEMYYEYGCFERAIQCYEEASKVHCMALSIGLQGNTESLLSEAIGMSLWKHLSALIHLEIDERKNLSQDGLNKILNIICSVILEGKVENSTAPPQGMILLRVRRKLSSFAELELSQISTNDHLKIKVISSSTKLLSICQLLTLGFKPACLVFEEFIKTMQKVNSKDTNCEHDRDKAKTATNLCQIIQEHIYEDYLWLINVAPKFSHIFSFLPMSLSSVREILRAALAIAPSNVTFLQKLTQYQSWRDILCGNDFGGASNGDILPIIFRLMPHIKKATEILISAESGAISAGYQLENILEAAVNSDTGSKCPLLWRLYMRLVGLTRQPKLKQISYRALNSCPNAKCLYMDFVRLVPEMLPDVLKLLGEKGIRVRLPLEELELLLEEEKEHEEEIHIEESGEQSEIADIPLPQIS